MNELNKLSKAVEECRSDIEGVLIPRLKAVEIELCNMSETLERYGDILSKLVEGFHQLGKDKPELTTPVQQETHAQSTITLQENNEKFAAACEKFKAKLESAQTAQKNMYMMLESLGYGIRIYQLELQIARLAKAGRAKKAAA
jgi:hypothetical protein